MEIATKTNHAVATGTVEVISFASLLVFVFAVAMMVYWFVFAVVSMHLWGYVGFYFF